MARLWRAYLPVPHAGTGAVVELGPEEGRHIQRVLRLGSGEEIAVFDGEGREWQATLVDADPRAVSVRIGAEITRPVEAPIEVVLFQGLCRAERFDWVVQKATELGARAIHPLRAERSEPCGRVERRLDRWRRIALEAAKQSGRRRVPLIEVHDALPSPPAARAWGLVLDPAGGPWGPAPAGSGRPPGRIWIAVGPESGFSAAELAAAAGGGWQRTALGPRTLRTETAGIVAIAIALHLWGDLAATAG